MTRLSSLPAATRARVVLITSDLRDRSDQLASLGISAGSEIELLQRSPAYVVQAGETRIALDDEIARYIFVQRET